MVCFDYDVLNVMLCYLMFLVFLVSFGVFGD